MIPVAALPAAVVKIIVQAFKHPNTGMKIEIDGTSVNVASWDESFVTDEGFFTDESFSTDEGLSVDDEGFFTDDRQHSEASAQARHARTMTEPRHAKTVS